MASEAHPEILVVDDERALADLVSVYLRRLGYKTQSCLTAKEALEKFEQAPTRYALLIVDARLADLPGEDLVLRARALRPELKVILTSGYAASSLNLPEDPTGRTCFLAKPFSPSELAALVKKLLATP